MKASNYLSIITVANLVISAVFSLAGIFAPSSISAAAQANSGAMVFALYAAARTIPLAIAALFAVARRDTSLILFLAVLAGIIQFADGFIGLYQQDPSKTIGPFLLAALTFTGIFMNLRGRKE